MSPVTPEQRQGSSSNKAPPWSVAQSPNSFAFVDDEKFLYIQLQYGSLISQECQERDVPYASISLRKLLDTVDTGTQFHDGWFLRQIIPLVLQSMDAFFDSLNIRPITGELVADYLPSEDTPFDDPEIMHGMSFSLPERPTAGFNARKLKRAILHFHDDPDSTDFYIYMRFLGKVDSVIRDAFRNVLTTNDRCIDDLYQGRDVNSAVEEMSAAMDREMDATKKTVFSDSQTPASDKQDHPKIPTGILKRPANDDGNVVTPPVGESSATAPEKRSERQSRTNTDGRSTTSRRRHDSGASINLGRYDYSDDESVDFEFAGTDRHEETTDTGTAQGRTANATAADPARKPTPRQLLKDMNTGRSQRGSRTSSKDVDRGGSDDGSSDSSQSGTSSGRSNSSRRRRRRKQRRSRKKKGNDPSWNSFEGRDKFARRRSKREIESARRRQGFIEGSSWMWHTFAFKDMVAHPDTHLHMPWTAKRDGYGEVLCHPVHVARQFADGELFLSNFNKVPNQTDLYQAQKAHSTFIRNFPVFRRGTSLSAYCYEVTNYALQYGHYVPPPFTLTSDNDLGILFEELPAIHQSYSLQTTKECSSRSLQVLACQVGYS